MTIYIVTYHKDFEWLDYLMRSIGKFAEGFREVLIVSDGDGHAIPAEILGHVKQMPVRVVYTPRPENKPASMEPSMIGYFWQQWLKLNWWQYSDDASVMHIDSDCMLTKRLTPDDLMGDNGLPLWHCRPWRTMPQQYWRESTEKQLRFETEFNCMIGQTFVFGRAATKDFLAYWIQQPAENWSWQFLIDNDVALFSEYNLFGNYLYHVNHHGYNLKVWEDTNFYRDHQYVLGTYKDRSWDGFTESITKCRDIVLKGNPPLETTSKETFTIIFPFYDPDEVRNFEWIMERWEQLTHCDRPYRFMLASRSDFRGSAINLLAMCRAYGEAEFVRLEGDMKGFPQGPNQMWYESLRHLKNEGVKHCFWMESDVMPQDPDWLSIGMNLLPGKLLTGHLVTDEWLTQRGFTDRVITNDDGTIFSWGEHINGCAFYDTSCVDFVDGSFNWGIAWDIQLYKKWKHRAHGFPMHDLTLKPCATEKELHEPERMMVHGARSISLKQELLDALVEKGRMSI